MATVIFPAITRVRARSHTRNVYLFLCVYLHCHLYLLWVRRSSLETAPRSSALFVLPMQKHYTVILACALLTLCINRGSAYLLLKVIRPVRAFSETFFYLPPPPHTHPLLTQAEFNIIAKRFFCAFFLKASLYNVTRYPRLIWVSFLTAFSRDKYLMSPVLPA